MISAYSPFPATSGQIWQKFGHQFSRPITIFAALFELFDRNFCHLTTVTVVCINEFLCSYSNCLGAPIPPFADNFYSGGKIQPAWRRGIWGVNNRPVLQLTPISSFCSCTFSSMLTVKSQRFDGTVHSEVGNYMQGTFSIFRILFVFQQV